MEYKLNSHFPANKTVLVVFLLITLGKFGIDLGFSLKPYMIFLMLFVIIHVSAFYFEKLQLFEIALLLFYMTYSFSGAFSLYPSSSLRIILGISLYLACYFILKSILRNSNDSIIERSIANVGIFFNITSLLLYIAGLKTLSLGSEGERISHLGVMVDRSYPRLIGLLQDPNFFVFYNTIFFAYFLCNANTLKNRLGLILCLVTNLLTFSRGGLLALIIIFAIYILLNNLVKQFQIFLGLASSLAIIAYIAIVQLKFDIFGILDSRINDFSNDGGSGRFELWGRAWDYFSSNVVLGIGAFNFSDYNAFQYQDTLTVHNTFLDILSESGILGFSCYLLFISFVIYQLIESRVYKKKPYLFLAFIGFVFQMVSLSVIINDIFFMYLAILSIYLTNEKQNRVKEIESKTDDSMSFTKEVIH
ncbi:O-antigen ligase family protein [Metabacillus idriensis]|uniref:O-antigen ligase family protein n=1 Tax=Metabacillus idriensis TaxID=324768 RepID=UPI0028139BF4|nr:O-antigen ligase family protein [Metabacillus idriensis]MDR0139305.1 O-antigen ligase family protein [Metabacillus idriensis]